MAVELSVVKSFLHVDFDNEDTYLTLLISNAEQFLRDSIDNYDAKISNQKFKNKADLVQLMIIQDMFDKRDFTTSNNEKLRFSVQSILRQMQYLNYSDEVTV